MVHVVNKGKQGEREAIKFLQPIIDKAYEQFQMEAPQLFRNQNQSALGGYDLDGLPWIALEIKRQETLNLNAWWAQVNKAVKGDQVPVVMFRQNRKQWRFLVPAYLHTGGQGHMFARAEITKESFQEWFALRLQYHIRLESESTESD